MGILTDKFLKGEDLSSQSGERKIMAAINTKTDELKKQNQETKICLEELSQQIESQLDDVALDLKRWSNKLMTQNKEILVEIQNQAIAAPSPLDRGHYETVLPSRDTFDRQSAVVQREQNTGTDEQMISQIVSQVTQNQDRAWEEAVSQVMESQQRALTQAVSQVAATQENAIQDAIAQLSATAASMSAAPVLSGEDVSAAAVNSQVAMQMEKNSGQLTAVRTHLDDMNDDIVHVCEEVAGVRNSLSELSASTQTLEQMSHSLDLAKGMIAQVNETVTESHEYNSHVQESVLRASEGIGDVQTGIGDVKIGINDLLLDVNVVKSSADAMMGNVDDMRGTVIGVQSSVEDMRSGMAQVLGSVEDIRSQVAQSQGGMEDMRTGVAQVLGSVEDIRSQVAQTQGGMEDMRTGVAQVQGSMDVMKTGITEVQNDMGDVQTDMSVMKAGMRNVQTDMGEVKENVSDVRSDITSMQEYIRDVEQKVADVQQTMQYLQSNIDGMGDRLDRVQQLGETIDALSNSMAGIQAMSGEQEEFKKVLKKLEGIRSISKIVEISVRLENARTIQSLEDFGEELKASMKDEVHKIRFVCGINIWFTIVAILLILANIFNLFSF